LIPIPNSFIRKQMPVRHKMKVMAATWSFGMKAIAAGWPILKSGGDPLDAVEEAVREVENDVLGTHKSVGLGGYPNMDGIIELDAAIMDGRTLQAGSVGAVCNVKNPISLARKVMKETPHVMIVGDGANRLAEYYGLCLPQARLQPDVEKELKKRLNVALNLEPKEGTLDLWLKNRALGIFSHDTVGVVALGEDGSLVAGTSTSGIAFKMPGRIGDSPIIGSGLVANEFGAAVATGSGENIMIHNVSRMVVRGIQDGNNAQEAAMGAIKDIVATEKRYENIAVLALDRHGNFGAATTSQDFEFAVMKEGMLEPRLFHTESESR